MNRNRFQKWNVSFQSAVSCWRWAKNMGGCFKKQIAPTWTLIGTWRMIEDGDSLRSSNNGNDLKGWADDGLLNGNILSNPLEPINKLYHRYFLRFFTVAKQHLRDLVPHHWTEKTVV